MAENLARFSRLTSNSASPYWRLLFILYLVGFQIACNEKDQLHITDSTYISPASFCLLAIHTVIISPVEAQNETMVYRKYIFPMVFYRALEQRYQLI